jgi:membrane-associated protease RseP (regulator of RpoE activity)
MAFELAPRAAIRQILGVRWVGLAVCFIASTALAAPRSSNPAFLGIQMQDTTGHGPCMIEAVTRESPAEAAGLRGGDLVLALDGKPIGSCSALLDEITAHAPGDAVQLKVQRLSAALVFKVQLTTRDALLHKVIGKPMVETNLVGVEDGEAYDLCAGAGRRRSCSRSCRASRPATSRRCSARWTSRSPPASSSPRARTSTAHRSAASS